MQICDDTASEHFVCGVRASKNSYRFDEAEQHFLRAIELSEKSGTNLFTLANALNEYGSLLIRMKRVDEGVVMIERRLALPKFNGEDRLERRCTEEHLAAFKASLSNPREVNV